MQDKIQIINYYNKSNFNEYNKYNSNEWNVQKYTVWATDQLDR